MPVMRLLLSALSVAVLLVVGSAVDAKPGKRSAPAVRAAGPQDGEAEARLIQVYRLIGQGLRHEALDKARALVGDYPHFQLAQLVYGDLLNSQVHALKTLGDVPMPMAQAAAPMLADLREESHLRLKALGERPPAQSIPAQFLKLSAQNKHAMAVDTSQSRLYLFENGSSGLRLVADYYISVGKMGVGKTSEGDLRTPLGVYFVSSNLNPKTLKRFYGVGALPLNYPNPFDLRNGRTGGGIWLHGSPPEQFARPPKATDGCVVLSNPDLQRIIRTVEIRTTPVVIAKNLHWVNAASLQPSAQALEAVLNAWRHAKSSGNLTRTLGFYASDFNSQGKPLQVWAQVLREEMPRLQGRELALKDLSILSWKDAQETAVVTFGEVAAGAVSGPVRRQYWMREKDQWKIFFEGVIG